MEFRYMIKRFYFPLKWLLTLSCDYAPEYVYFNKII